MFRHRTKHVDMFHFQVHRLSQFALATAAVQEELHQLDQRFIAIGLVGIDPLIDQHLDVRLSRQQVMKVALLFRVLTGTSTRRVIPWRHRDRTRFHGIFIGWIHRGARLASCSRLPSGAACTRLSGRRRCPSSRGCLGLEFFGAIVVVVIVVGHGGHDGRGWFNKIIAERTLNVLSQRSSTSVGRHWERRRRRLSEIETGNGSSY